MDCDNNAGLQAKLMGATQAKNIFFILGKRVSFSVSTQVSYSILSGVYFSISAVAKFLAFNIKSDSPTNNTGNFSLKISFKIGC